MNLHRRGYTGKKSRIKTLLLDVNIAQFGYTFLLLARKLGAFDISLIIEVLQEMFSSEPGRVVNSVYNGSFKPRISYSFLLLAPLGFSIQQTRGKGHYILYKDEALLPRR